MERFKAKNTKATQAASRLKQIEKLKEQLPEITEDPDVIEFSFAETIASGGVPIKLCDVSVGYGNEPVFSIRSGHKPSGGSGLLHCPV